MPAEVLSDAKDITPFFPAATAVVAGDLMYYDAATNLAKKASMQADAGSLAANQAAFAPLFLGVSRDNRLVGETVSQRRTVHTNGVYRMPTSSRIWKIGELVGVGRDATPLNTNQQVEVTAVLASSIGVCIQDSNGVAVTSVLVQLVSNVVPKA